MTQQTSILNVSVYFEHLIHRHVVINSVNITPDPRLTRKMCQKFAIFAHLYFTKCDSLMVSRCKFTVEFGSKQLRMMADVCYGYQ